MTHLALLLLQGGLLNLKAWLTIQGAAEASGCTAIILNKLTIRGVKSVMQAMISKTGSQVVPAWLTLVPSAPPASIPHRRAQPIVPLAKQENTWKRDTIPRQMRIIAFLASRLTLLRSRVALGTMTLSPAGASVPLASTMRAVSALLALLANTKISLALASVLIVPQGSIHAMASLTRAWIQEAIASYATKASIVRRQVTRGTRRTSGTGLVQPA
jgi:hypothetical protein